MKSILTRIFSSWRVFVTSLFVFLVFMMPSARGVIAKIFNVNVEAGSNKNKPPKPPKSGSVSVPSVSSPNSNSTASPMQNSNSSSTGNSFAANGSKPIAQPARK